MIGRRAVVGLSLLCALVFCAFAAPNAAAAKSKGTTQFTCVKVATAKTGDFNDEHCKEPNAKHEGEFTHEVIPNEQKTEVVGVNTNNAVLKSTIGGLESVITCTAVASTGTATNETVPPEEEGLKRHTLSGTGISIKYTKCTAKVGKEECIVKGGTVEVPSATSMDVEEQTISYTTKGVETKTTFKMGILFEPPAGKPFATFELEKCKFAGKYEVEGKALGVPEGATLTFTQASTEPTLKLSGQQAFFENTLTVRMGPASKPGNPISTTTTP